MLTTYRVINLTQQHSIFHVMLEEQFKKSSVTQVPVVQRNKIKLVSNNGAIVTL